MAKYLLQCECGESHVISNHQAGKTIACSCGKDLVVPTLRNLAELPRVDEADDKPKSSWGVRQGVFTAALLVALLLGGVAAWFQWQTPAPPEPFDVIARSEFFEENVDKLTAEQAWKLWMIEFKPLEKLGIRQMVTPQDRYILGQITKCTYYRNLFGIAAGSVLAVGLLATSLVPGSPRE